MKRMLKENELLGDLHPQVLGDNILVEEVEKKDPFAINYDTELVDFEEGLVYEKKRWGRGYKRIKVLRKFVESLDTHDYNREGIRFWKPRLKNLVECEARRWKALQYQIKQMQEFHGRFEATVNACPFRCIRVVDRWPGFEWYSFEKHDFYGYHGDSHSLCEHRIEERDARKSMKYPIKQDMGDAYYAYRERSELIRKRYNYFHLLFFRSLQERYAGLYYKKRSLGQHVLKLKINGKDYIVGSTGRDSYGGDFGVIAYPEETVEEVVN